MTVSFTAFISNEDFYSFSKKISSEVINIIDKQWD
jgi:hypothetical protein